MLKVNNLSTKFLKWVSFEVKKWDVFNVVWPNGAGKSTLWKSLVGLEKLNSWEIVMDDKNIHNLSTEKEQKNDWYMYFKIFQYILMLLLNDILKCFCEKILFL